jgi:PAS domain S-box-containing protein
MQHIDAARLLTHVPVGVVVVSPQDQIVYANPAFCYLHDYTSEDVIGRRPIALIHPEDRMIGVIAGQQLAMGLINEIVFVRRHLRRDGTIIRLRARVTTLREADGSLEAFLAVVEVTDDPVADMPLSGVYHQQVERQLKRILDHQHALALCSQELLRPAATPAVRQHVLIRAITHILDATNSSRISLWQNVEDAERGLCLRMIADAHAPGRQSLTQVPRIVIPPLIPWSLAPPIHQRHLADGLSVGGLVEQMYAGSPMLDAVRYAGIHASLVVPIHLDGVWWGVLSFDHDQPCEWDNDERLILRTSAELFGQIIRYWDVQDALRETVTLEARTEALSLTNAALNRALRLKDEFLAMMSHELRTPLTIILGMTEAMDDELYGPISDSQRHALAGVLVSSRHLLAIITNILDLNDIESKHAVLDDQLCDVDLLCHIAVQFVHNTAQQKAIRVLHTVEDGITGLRTDERRMTQILVNLLDNAVKFTPANGTVGLEVTADADEERIQFVIWDTGIGIAEEDYDRLFQPFTQVDGQLTRQYGGIGLGLTLVRRLVELHGGSICVVSTPGQGSRFTVSLPWTVGDNTIPLVAHTPTPPLPKWAKPPQMLIADDHELTLQFYTEMFRMQGCGVVMARTGAEAVTLVRETHPDVVVMDIQMPDLDGLTAIRRMREDPTMTSISIIALTALAMPGDQERCLAAGASDYVTKPVSLKTLMATMERLLSKGSEPGT